MPLLDKLRKLYGVGPVCSELHIVNAKIIGRFSPFLMSAIGH
ncbi:hypothetical protein AC22_0743 [Escherichia coli 5-366-08_S3_C2]|nr:hypothetical protein AC22_0743 [Escherichia coli 5-366-08_S3_C2]